MSKNLELEQEITSLRTSFLEASERIAVVERNIEVLNRLHKNENKSRLTKVFRARTENPSRGGIGQAETSSFWTRDMYIEGRTAFNFYRGVPGRRLCIKNPNDQAYFQRPSRDQSYEIVKVSTTVLAVY